MGRQVQYGPSARDRYMNETTPMASTTPIRDFIRAWKLQVFGPHGLMIEQRVRRPREAVQQHYSYSLLAAISQDEVMSIQLVEGGVDGSVFENFIYELLMSVRS
jgi:hypothetical protein